ncbi:hypothetical protein MRX96_058682 [Rhipicephalus microplus]
MDELTFSRLSLFCAEKNSGLLNSTVVHVAVELMDSDSDKEYDDLVAAVAMKSARLYLHRMPSSDAGAPRCQATDLDASPGPRLDERDTDGLRLADLDLE